MAIVLKLGSTLAMPRSLAFSLTNSGKTLSLEVFVQGRRISYLFGNISDDWYVDTSVPALGPCIWQRGTAIELDDTELALIRRTYEVHGLAIRSPCAAPIGPATAKQAAPAVPSSSGSSGVTPPANSAAGGELDQK